MATALIGSIGPYNESEDIDTYIDRVELFFVANSVPDDKKVATFLSISDLRFMLCCKFNFSY